MRKALSSPLSYFTKGSEEMGRVPLESHSGCIGRGSSMDPTPFFGFQDISKVDRLTDRRSQLTSLAGIAGDLD